MSFQPMEEKIAERQLIIEFATRMKGKVIKLQGDIDDGKTDGIVEINGKIISVEARRKGYPNHKGISCSFPEGWDTYFLSDGIFLNTPTIESHIKTGFAYVVEILAVKLVNDKLIERVDKRACFITPRRIKELLNQRYRTQNSTNASGFQSVKYVPLEWFTIKF